jgi:phage terminase large subunit-like protein
MFASGRSSRRSPAAARCGSSIATPASLPIFANGKLWAFIASGDEGQRLVWRGTEDEAADYYAEQRKTLRPGTFARLHLNEWQSGEEAFILAEEWDACVDPEARPLLPASESVEAQRLRLSVGVDAATKGDCAAVVAVATDSEGRVRLCRHRIWTPRPGEPLDLEETVEAFVLELHRRYRLATCTFDPFQMARSATTLRQAGVRMVELSQTSGNLTAAGQNLYELVRGRNLVMYSDGELRRHALNAAAVETARGWRLAKEKASRKIDGVVALSFAALDAVENRRGPASGELPVVGGARDLIHALSPPKIRYDDSL